MKNFFKSTYLAFVFLFLYLPITVLIIFSFNSGSSIRNFQSWSWEAYGKLFQEGELWQALSVTLIVATISTVIAVVIGTLAALGLSKTKKLTRNLTLGATNIPLVNADIVTAVSLMLLFVAFAFNFGLFTLILAHISFNIPYVIITVLPKIRQIDEAQLEASQDLGATPWYTLRKIVLPTLKPAILTGAAIAFSMSFDDFIISYFTGGNAANVSTYIYSLKRIQPFINAFSTIIIVLIAIMIISANAYKIIRKQLRARNDMIMDGIYRDKKIIRLEKQLNRYYLHLNNVKLKKKKKWEASFYPVNMEHEWESIIWFKKIVKKNEKIVKNINRLEHKLQVEYVWVQQIKHKILDKKRQKERKARVLRDKYHFLRWPWRMIMVCILIFTVFGGAVALYATTSRYDLTVANWGGYIDSQTLRNFEEQYNVKVKYTTYDDNESLYAKLATTNYDVMVPSDYMVAKLASEGRVEKLDQSKLGNLGINVDLKGLMDNYKFDINAGDDKGTEAVLSDYAVPYFWGDLVLVLNTVQDPNLLAELDPTLTDPNQANWDIINKAISLGKKIVLNNDMHNLFMMGLATLNYDDTLGHNNGTGQYKQTDNKFQDYVNPQNNKDIDNVKDWLKPIIKYSNTRLQNDELIDTIASNTGWDIAVAYNGDILNAISQDVSNTQYTIVRPYVGTNDWVDSMVISKVSTHQELAYDFIKFIMNQDTQTYLSTTFGYTSPVQAAMDQVSALRPGTIWSDVYTPGNLQIIPPDNPSATKGFYNGLFKNQFDPYMQSKYNELLSFQGDNNVISLLIQFIVILIIIVMFMFVIWWFK